VSGSGVVKECSGFGLAYLILGDEHTQFPQNI